MASTNNKLRFICLPPYTELQLSKVCNEMKPIVSRQRISNYCIWVSSVIFTMFASQKTPHFVSTLVCAGLALPNQI